MECRRILKWTYAYGYYRFGDNISEEDSAQKQQQGFFEFNQVSLQLFQLSSLPLIDSEGSQHCEVLPKLRMDKAHHLQPNQKKVARLSLFAAAISNR